MASDGPRTYRHRIAEIVSVTVAPEVLFEYLDDHERLAAHMMQASPMMAGSSMAFTFDEGRGRRLGSRIVMRGAVLGIRLEVSEVITEREPPRRKAWESQGVPSLLVIGSYRMGFEIAPEGTGSRLVVFIDYNLSGWPWRPLGLLMGHFYARWCVWSMARDAALTFSERRKI